VLRSVVENRRPLATAKSKNTCHGAPRPRRGFVHIHATARLRLFEGTFFRQILCLCSSPAATEWLCRRQRSGHRPEHRDQKRTKMCITGRRRRRPHQRPHRGHTEPLYICRAPFSCCGSVGLRRVAAPAWAPRSKTCRHVEKRASTPEGTPRLYSAGEVGALTAKKCALTS
jgi:hypothetical protein